MYAYQAGFCPLGYGNYSQTDSATANNLSHLGSYIVEVFRNKN